VRGRIAAAFARASSEGRAALVAFVEAGDPDAATSARILEALFEAGADVVELGVPFSDPIADGVVIQRASERSLAAGGGLGPTLDLAAAYRAAGGAGALVLFSYSNPVLAMGEAEFAARARGAGVDGVLITDLPPEEGRRFAAILRSARIDPIYLLAPTSPRSRVRKAASLSSGFVYLVSRAGVTGARADLPPDLPELAARVRGDVGRLPVAIGFGISTPEQVAAAARLADGVVVGSAIVRAIEEASASGSDAVVAASELVRRLAAGTRRPPAVG
jgi:tryptophan synthase alpha chain